MNVRWIQNDTKACRVRTVNATHSNECNDLLGFVRKMS